MAPTTRGKLAALAAALALFSAADAEDSCSSIASTFQEEDQGLSLRQLRVHEKRTSAGGAGEAKSPPVVPEVWSASLKVDSTMAIPTHSTAGTFFYDAPRQTFKMTFQIEIMNKTLKYETLGISEVTNYTIGATCLPGEEGPTFNSFFSWLPNATHDGQMVVDGKTCEAWKASGVPFTMVACINPDNTPRHWRKQLSPSLGGGIAGDLNYTFSKVSVGPGSLARTSFKPTPACLAYSHKPCPDSSPITLETYRIGSPGPWMQELGNRNSGDALAEAIFLCTQDASSTKIITVWRVQTFGSFGQYALCNFKAGKNVCTGGSLIVGRRSTNYMGAGAAAGQCSANEDVGTQFSWPVDVECADNNTFGTGDCTWKAQRVRAVAVSCVLTRGLLDQCGQGQDKAREATFLKAVAAPEDGGCPSVD